MYTNSILAVTGVLVSAVAAVPRAEFQHHHHQHHAKRDLVWVTKWEEVVETIPVTKTVWVEPGDTVPTPYSTDMPETPAAYTPPVPAAAPASSPAPAKPAVAEYNPPAVESKPAADTQPAAPAYEAPSSSPVAPAAPAPTTEAYVAPAPASTYVAPAPEAPAPSSAAAPAPVAAPSSPSYEGGSSSGGSSGGKSFTGDLTWYEVGLGACGITSTSSEPVVAVSHVLFDAVSTGNSNTNPLCGQKVSITGADGTTYTGTIVDRCPGCDEGSLDLSQSFFNKVTNNGDGRVGNMKWTMAS